jgi:hypothetical protein
MIYLVHGIHSCGTLAVTGKRQLENGLPTHSDSQPPQFWSQCKLYDPLRFAMAIEGFTASWRYCFLPLQASSNLWNLSRMSHIVHILGFTPNFGYKVRSVRHTMNQALAWRLRTCSQQTFIHRTGDPGSVFVKSSKLLLCSCASLRVSRNFRE